MSHHLDIYGGGLGRSVSDSSCPSPSTAELRGFDLVSRSLSRSQSSGSESEQQQQRKPNSFPRENKRGSAEFSRPRSVEGERGRRDEGVADLRATFQDEAGGGFVGMAGDEDDMTNVNVFPAPVMSTVVADDRENNNNNDTPLYALRVSDVPASVSESEVRKSFGWFGEVHSVGFSNGEVKKLAFINFLTASQAETAFREVAAGTVFLGGAQVRVDAAFPPKQTSVNKIAWMQQQQQQQQQRNPRQQYQHQQQQQQQLQQRRIDDDQRRWDQQQQLQLQQRREVPDRFAARGATAAPVARFPESSNLSAAVKSSSFRLESAGEMIIEPRGSHLICRLQNEAIGSYVHQVLCREFIESKIISPTELEVPSSAAYSNALRMIQSSLQSLSFIVLPTQMRIQHVEADLITNHFRKSRIIRSFVHVEPVPQTSANDALYRVYVVHDDKQELMQDAMFLSSLDSRTLHLNPSEMAVFRKAPPLHFVSDYYAVSEKDDENDAVVIVAPRDKRVEIVSLLREALTEEGEMNKFKDKASEVFHKIRDFVFGSSENAPARQDRVVAPPPPQNFSPAARAAAVNATNETIIRRAQTKNGRILEIAIGNIVMQNVEAVVNAANGGLSHGGGIAAALKQAAGPNMQAECFQIVARDGIVAEGNAVSTRAGGDLEARGVRYIIHTVGPMWREDDDEGSRHLLRSAVGNALKQADFLKVKSIAIPAISAGIFRGPLETVTQVIVTTVLEHLSSFQTTSSLKLVRILGINAHFADTFARALDNIERLQRSGQLPLTAPKYAPPRGTVKKGGKGGSTASSSAAASAAGTTVASWYRSPGDSSKIPFSQIDSDALERAYRKFLKTHSDNPESMSLNTRMKFVYFKQMDMTDQRTGTREMLKRVEKARPSSSSSSSSPSSTKPTKFLAEFRYLE